MCFNRTALLFCSVRILFLLWLAGSLNKVEVCRILLVPNRPMPAVRILLNRGYFLRNSNYASVVVSLTISLKNKFHSALHRPVVFINLLKARDVALGSVRVVLIMFWIDLREVRLSALATTCPFLLILVGERELVCRLCKFSVLFTDVGILFVTRNQLSQACSTWLLYLRIFLSQVNLWWAGSYERRVISR